MKYKIESITQSKIIRVWLMDVKPVTGTKPATLKLAIDVGGTGWKLETVKVFEGAILDFNDDDKTLEWRGVQVFKQHPQDANKFYLVSGWGRAAKAMGKAKGAGEDVLKQRQVDMED